MKNLLIGLMLALLLAACTTTPGTPPQPPTDPDEALPIVELAQSAAQVLPHTQAKPNVLALNRARIEAVVVGVDRSSGSITFDKNTLTPQEWAKLVPGNVIVGQAGKRTKRGVLRKITGMSEQGARIVVQTSKATLADVFAEGGFRVQGQARLRDATALILPDGKVERLQPQTGLSPQGLVFPVTINVCPINLDGKTSTKSDQVCVSGSLDLDLNFDITFTCGPLCASPYLDAKATFSEAAKLTVEGELTKSVGKTIPIGTVPLGSFAVLIAGIPVVFVAEVDLSVTLEGQVAANLTYTADQSLSFTAGVEFDKGKFNPYTDFDADTDSSSVEVSLDMEATATLSGEASVLVYGVGGPTVTLDGWVKLEAGFPRNPTWELTAGLDLLLGLEMDVFGLINLDWKEKVMDLDWDIAQAPNSKPTVILKNPVDGQTVSLPEEKISNGTVSIWQIPDADVKTDDAEEGVNCCTVSWYVDDVLKRTTPAGSGHQTNLVFGSTGPHTLRLEATDSSGGKTSTYTLTIESCQTGMVGGRLVCIEPMGINNPFKPHL